MGVLLIDSSSGKIGFGYAEDSELVLNEELEPSNNADTLTFFIKEAFEKRNIKFENVSIVSLSNGPGSFTGLRIGSAISKGICFATGSKLVEVPTLDLIANKFKKDGRIISLIFSNQRSLEFYYCEYLFEKGKLNRVSDYKTGNAGDIINDESVYLINESLNEEFPEDFRNKLTDVSGYSNVVSQHELSRDLISGKEFVDFRNSKPNYMKEFVPKI